MTCEIPKIQLLAFLLLLLSGKNHTESEAFMRVKLKCLPGLHNQAQCEFPGQCGQR